MSRWLISPSAAIAQFQQSLLKNSTNTVLGSKRDFTMLSPSLIFAFTSLILISYLVLILGATRRNRSRIGRANNRNTPLPGFGIFGDHVNEFIEIFLDSLAIYVHNDREWECPRRLLCEANQRAVDSGTIRGFLMYISSLIISFLLKDRTVSISLEAMKKGRMGHDCVKQYPCPFSL